MEKVRCMKAQITAFRGCRLHPKAVERNPMKAQMFIVTIVFLVGLIFTVQQSLFQYSFLDLPAQSERNDYYIFSNVKDIINQTIRTAETCLEAEQNVEETAAFLDKQILKGGYVLEIIWSFECANWDTQDPVLNLTIHLKGADTDTTGTFYLYNK